MYRKNVLVLFFLIFLTTCTEPNHSVRSMQFSIDAEEKEWLREFFRDLLFNFPGAYTLYGTKPISLSLIYHLTEQDQVEMNQYMNSLPDEDKATLRKKRYDYDANYAKWEKIQQRFAIRQYLFGKFPVPNDEKVELVIFLNIETTLRTLLQYYEDFKKILKHDFDPIQVVFEVQNKNSEFWHTVLNHGALQGILFGFGQDNSWFFQWQTEHENENNQMGAFLKSLPSKFDENKHFENYDAQNFQLPIFKVFGLHADDHLIEQYKKEREQIKALYKGRDEVDVALEWLTR